MPTFPEIPVAAINAAEEAIRYRAPDGDAHAAASAAIAAALPHLIPGLYVTRDCGDVTVWRERPDCPTVGGRPGRDALDVRDLTEVLAGLLPDRTYDPGV